VDSPTRYGTDTGAGGEVRGNYATWNPINNGLGGTVSNGNLTLSGVSVIFSRINSTIGVSSGKWYFEVTLTTAGDFTTVGIGQGNITNQYPGIDALSYAQSLENASSINNNTQPSYGTAFTSGDVFMCAFDLDNNKLFFGKNGTWFGSSDPVAGTNPVYTLAAGTYNAIARPNPSGFASSAVLDANFGQRPFSYTAPSGFKALVTTNLPTPTIEKGGDYFNAILYTGTGSSNARTGVGFQPDFVWVKSRNNTWNHALFDAVRGTTKYLESNTTASEFTNANSLTAFGSDGFTVGSASIVNANNDTFVAWNWKANGAGVSNTDGTITSTVSVNTTSGFSIVNWTSTGSNATVGHGLGVAPAMVIVKGRSATSQWFTWHTSLTSGAYALILNLTDAQDSYPTVFNSTTPTSSVFSVGTSLTNGTTAVAYCFAPVAGYSAFGSYTGNGSADGTFVFTGFRPRWVMLKRTDAGDGWLIRDSIRNPYNVTNLALLANESTAEYVDTTLIDFTSNGFKFRHQNSLQNASGGTYIYMAFAENPFAYSLAR